MGRKIRKAMRHIALTDKNIETIKNNLNSAMQRLKNKLEIEIEKHNKWRASELCRDMELIDDARRALTPSNDSVVNNDDLWMNNTANHYMASDK
jgi:hypothetical protein